VPEEFMTCGSDNSGHPQEIAAKLTGSHFGFDLSTMTRLRAPGAGASPKFMLRALRDPDGANLDRIQIIKGWLDTDGKTHEKIWDVACADREIIEGKCKGAVGTTVDVQQASYTNTIGDAALGGYWIDSEFDPAQRAF